jgi:exosortase A
MATNSAVSPSRHSSWPAAWIVLGASFGLLLAIYWPTAASVAANWSRDPFGHGYLVVPVLLYVAWRRRAALYSRTPAPSFWPLVGLALLAFVWLLGNLSATSIVQQLCLVAMFVAFVWSVLGTDAAKALMFPIGLLLFALPLGDRLVPVLQDFTARFAVEMLRLVRVPALLEGHVISIPGSSWRVAEACSGINYLVSSLAFGYLYAGLTYRRWTHRIGFFAASAAAPLIANGLRVFTTILVASLGATGVAAGMEHNLLGVAVFAVTTYVLVALCGHWREDGAQDLPASIETKYAAGTISSNSRLIFVASLGLILVAAAPLSARWLPLTALPAEYAGQPALRVSSPWQMVDRDPFGWRPRAASPSAETLRTYDSGGATVRVYVASYRATQPAVKLATASNELFDRPWWASAERRVPVKVDGRSFRARETVLSSQRSSLRVWSWYSVSGTPTGDDYMAKVLLAKARLFRSPEGAALVAIATEERAPSNSSAVLHNFVEHFSFGSHADLSTSRLSIQ